MVSRKTPEELPPGWKEHVKNINGRKIKCYTSVVTGQKFYSKIGVIRYVNSNNACQATSLSGSKPENQRSHAESKASPILVKTAESPEWLPRGWIMEARTRKSGNIQSIYKVYIDPSSGCRFYSKPQVIRYLQSIDLKNSAGKLKEVRNSPKEVSSQHSEYTESKCRISEKKKNGMGKPSLKICCSDVEESNSRLDELPPGWIKEIWTRKSGCGIRKDPYYIDPENGFAFRSKKDALRYVKAGDIHSCKMKPQKRDITELKTLKDAIQSASPPEGNKVRLSAKRRQLCVGEKSNDAECSQKKEGDGIPVDPKVTTSNVAVEEMHSCSKAVECDISGESSKPKTEDFEQDIGVVSHNGADSSIESAGLHEQKLPVSQLDTEIGFRKSRKRKPQSMPARSSKRLAGNEPEMVPNFDLSERSLRAAVKKPREIQANRSASSSHDADANAVPQQLDTTAEPEAACHISVCAEDSIEIDPQNSRTMPLEDQAVKQQTVWQASDRQDEENPGLQGDYWSDPCFDFAIKTLIGAIPVEDTLALQGCLQQHIDTSYTQGDVSFGQPAMDIPSFFQNDVLYHLDSVQNNMSTDQLPSNSTSSPPGNISLPGCSSRGSHPPGLNPRSKDYQAKVNS